MGKGFIDYGRDRVMTALYPCDVKFVYGAHIKEVHKTCFSFPPLCNMTAKTTGVTYLIVMPKIVKISLFFF